MSHRLNNTQKHLWKLFFLRSQFMKKIFFNENLQLEM
ncbi:Uncharacterised protein [Vibrio cholerae]|nr:Uncharacterised protein [Vibrio cholerae]